MVKILSVAAFRFIFEITWSIIWVKGKGKGKGKGKCKGKGMNHNY